MKNQYKVAHDVSVVSCKLESKLLDKEEDAIGLIKTIRAIFLDPFVGSDIIYTFSGSMVYYTHANQAPPQIAIDAFC